MDKSTQLLDELQDVLEKQIKLAQQGNLSEFEVLSGEADDLVGQIARSGILKRPEFEARHDTLEKLYRNLCLAVSSQKADTREKLGQVRKGKKTVKAYRSSI